MPADPASALLQAREAIRDTLAAYTWCGDNGDIDGFVATFAPDGVLEIKDQARYEGRAALQAGVRSGFGAPPERAAAMRAAGRLSHHVSSLRIELADLAQARAWSYYAVIGAGGLDHWGRYTDVLVPIGGRWLFKSRRVSIDGAAAGSVVFPASP